VKARNVYYHYRNAVLGRSLDRVENLYGLAGDYVASPALKLVGEYRHQDVYYQKQGETKDKNSDFLMAGADYDIARKLTTSGRVGVEWRRRSTERSTTSPYVELSGKYDYADGSFITGGYTYTLEESSDTSRFTDTKVDRVFANVQHTITPLLIASGSLTYESSILQGRRTFANISEDTIRGGLALSYLPNKHWTISGSYDDDHVTSDEAARKLDRERVALSAAYTF
jgi:predicted porin